MNHYAYQYLEEQECKQWEERMEDDSGRFTKMFGLDKMGSYQISEFLDYFIIRNVMSGEAFMKIAVRVMKKLTKWLYDKNYVNKETHEDYQDFFKEEAKELPNMEKLAELIFHHPQKSPEIQYEAIQEVFRRVISL